jgi:hypothetical protein
MQPISDLEAEVAALTGENQSLKASQRNGHSHPQPNPEELANAIGARLARVEQNLREDFVGKFAASFLLASETITSRLNTLDQRESELEARQKKPGNQITESLRGGRREAGRGWRKAKEMDGGVCQPPQPTSRPHRHSPEAATGYG